MLLTKLKKEFPKDYDVVRKGKIDYVPEHNGRVRYKYIVIGDKKKGTDIQIPRKEHHPVYKLLLDLRVYNLSNKEERKEYLSALSVAFLMDDYNLIDKKLYTATSAIKEISAIDSIDGFVIELEKVKDKVKSVQKYQGVSEIQEERAEGKPLAVEVE